MRTWCGGEVETLGSAKPRLRGFDSRPHLQISPPIKKASSFLGAFCFLTIESTKLQFQKSGGESFV
jgi:hypothetical protein